MAELELDKLSMDPAAQELLKKAQAEGVETIFDRAKVMKPCPIGIEGACCRICAQDPCRVPPPKKKEGETTAEKKQRMGLCSATAETIVPRNFALMVAAGTSAHSDHARGVAGVVGCNNCRTAQDTSHMTLIKELIKNDVIVLSTGCAAMAAGKYGLLTPEAAKYCGPGLGEICETVGIPPVLHMGACVDNSRILMAATACVKAGGLGTDISDLPAAGAAPEWMSEKANRHRPVLRGLGGVHAFRGKLAHHRLRDSHRLPLQGHQRRAGR
jgi:hydroxylamine reductase (hybrid-cluster protein)